MNLTAPDAQVIGGFLVLVVILVNFWIASNSRRVERRDDMGRRARDKVERDAKAA